MIFSWRNCFLSLLGLSCLAHLCSSFLYKKNYETFQMKYKTCRKVQNRTDLFSTPKIKQMLTYFSTSWSLFYRHKMLHRYILAPYSFSHHPSAEEKTCLKLFLYNFFVCLYFYYVCVLEHYVLSFYLTIMHDFRLYLSFCNFLVNMF